MVQFVTYGHSRIHKHFLLRSRLTPSLPPLIVFVDRGAGVGTAFVRQLLSQADGAFHSVRLRTKTREAADCYVSLGFMPCRKRQSRTSGYCSICRNAMKSIPGLGIADVVSFYTSHISNFATVSLTL